VVSRSNAESEYRAMANVTLKLIWIKDLLTEIGFSPVCHIRLYGEQDSNTHC